MRKYIYSIIFILIACVKLAAQSQYKPWKLDVGVLVGEITQHDVGVMFPYIEPKYNLTDNFAIGIRSEFITFYNEGFWDEEMSSPHWSNLDADGSVFSLALTADKYFTNNTVRPFIGLGGGYYLVQVEGKNNFLNLKENLNTGGIITRAGLNFGHFRIAGEYNHIFSSRVNVNYFSIKLGYEFGGGKKLFW